MAVSTTGTRLSDTSSPVPECTPVSAHPADCRNSQFSVLLRHPIRNLENGAGICFANKLATEQLVPGLEACSGFNRPYAHDLRYGNSTDYPDSML